MIQSSLIANRGEVACRIIRTARAISLRAFAPSREPTFLFLTRSREGAKKREVRRPKILPGTGRGTMRSMGEGQVDVGCDGWGGVAVEAVMLDVTLPLHQLRWFPSPFRGGFAL